MAIKNLIAGGLAFGGTKWLVTHGFTVGAAAPPVDDADDLHYRCLVAVHAVLQGLTFNGITSDRIVLRKLPTDRGLDITTGGGPAIIVSYPASGQETFDPGSFEDDEVGYPVLVTIARVSNQDLTLDGTWTAWRRQVVAAFLDQPLAGVDESCDVQIEPGGILDPGAFFEQQLDVGALTLRVKTFVDLAWR